MWTERTVMYLKILLIIIDKQSKPTEIINIQYYNQLFFQLTINER